MEDIRQMEDETQKELEELRNKGPVRGTTATPTPEQWDKLRPDDVIRDAPTPAARMWPSDPLLL